jgi:hypothetical protein
MSENDLDGNCCVSLGIFFSGMAGLLSLAPISKENRNGRATATREKAMTLCAAANLSR